MTTDIVPIFIGIMGLTLASLITSFTLYRHLRSHHNITVTMTTGDLQDKVLRERIILIRDHLYNGGKDSLLDAQVVVRILDDALEGLGQNPEP